MGKIYNELGLDMKQELDIIFKYYKKLRDDYNSGEFVDKTYEQDEACNYNTIMDKLFYFIIDLRGYNKVPLVVSDEEFEKDLRENTRKTVYHGFEEFSYGANFLWDFYYHYGDGGYGAGFYTTRDSMETLSYTANKDRADENKVLKMIINSKNGVNIAEIEALARNLTYNMNAEYNRDLVVGEDVYNGEMNLSDSEAEEFIQREKTRREMFKALCEYIREHFPSASENDYLTYGLFSNASILCAYLGFDYATRVGRDSEHFLVFNRGVVETSESEFKRFVSNAVKNIKTLGI